MKKHFNSSENVSLAFLLVTLAAPVSVWAEAGAKSLFESEGTTIMRSDTPSDTETAPISKPTVKQHTTKVAQSYAGLQYWIDLQTESGASQRVTTNHTFQSGDRIQLKVKSNTPGYLYVMNAGSSGRFNKLYPARGQLSQLIQPGIVQTIPNNSAIRFDNTPGSEKVSILLTKMPIYDEPIDNGSAVAPVSYVNQTSYSACSSSGSKDLFNEENAGAAIDCVKNNYGSGSKDLFAEEDPVSAQPASYAVIPANTLDTGRILSVDFNLIHR